MVNPPLEMFMPIFRSAEAVHNLRKVNVAVNLHTELQKQMMDHRTAVSKMFSTIIKVLAQQGLALRGNNDDS